MLQSTLAYGYFFLALGELSQQILCFKRLVPHRSLKHHVIPQIPLPLPLSPTPYLPRKEMTMTGP